MLAITRHDGIVDLHSSLRQVQVTQQVVDLVTQFDGMFKIEKRGLVEVKGKGSILTYFVSR